MFLSEWREFLSAPCLAGKKKPLMIARVLMVLKSRASLICFRACFLPGRAKDGTNVCLDSTRKSSDYPSKRMCLDVHSTVKVHCGLSVSSVSVFDVV